jgi:CubicO group peptidase (beta-lactamase class C family)
VRRELARQVDAGTLVGAQYLAVTADETLVDLHIGAADAATSRPMERETRQMAYSITKAITAIAALRLVDDGLLSLERPLSH